MPAWWLPVLIGLAFGTAVAGLNHFLLIQAIRQTEVLGPLKAKNKVLVAYSLRLVFDFLALIIMYKNVPMLIGTAIGLTMSERIFLVKHFRNKKQ